MSRTVSARIPNELHEELRERCNQLGCTITEWIVNAIDFCMQPEGSTDFDFGGDEEDSDEIKQVLKPEKVQDSHEGKMPTLHFHWENDKLVQDETTWEKRPELDEDKYKPHYDSHGNYYTYDENRKMWTCHLNPDKVKIVP